MDAPQSLDMLTALHRQREYGRCIEACREHLRAHPGDAEAWYLLSACHWEEADYGLCLEAGLRNQAAQPEYLRARGLIAGSCAQLGLTSLARRLIGEWVATLAPEPDQQAWRPIWLNMIGEYEESVQRSRELLAMSNGDAYVAHFMADPLWSLGRLEEGTRMRQRGCTETFMRTYYPGWLESTGLSCWEGQSLNGKTLLLMQRGGLGDCIHFMRYARVIRAQGGRVVVNLSYGNARELIAGCDDVEIYDPAVHQPDYVSDPIALFAWLFPAHGFLPANAYVRAPASAAADAILASARSRAAGRPVVAINWDSDSPNGGRIRSAPLEAMLPLLARQDLYWLVLQRGVALRRFLQHGIWPHCQAVGDGLGFDDTAAVIAAADATVTIDTYSVHMAGALGRPAVLLGARAMEWRNADWEDSSMWYPSVRIARQPVLGDWRGAVTRAATALDEQLGPGGRP